MLRAITPAGQASYDALMTSGLYEAVVKAGLLISHRELKDTPAGVYKVIEPARIPFISYPYEWSFSQLKDAALTTLRIQKIALEYGMTLRDASAYNIQFVAGKPCLIDTLSFESYERGTPWQAYQQFCRHFLAPLALASTRDVDLIQLLRVHLDGVPLPLAAKLLPARSKLKPGLVMHIMAHARFQRSHEKTVPTRRANLSQNALSAMLESLERTVTKLTLPTTETEWGDYYDNTNYSKTALGGKEKIVEDYIRKVNPKRVIDLGANNGLFSRVAAEQAQLVISADIDPLAVDDNYRRVRHGKETNLIPVLIDLFNPSPALGWANRERQSFTERGRADVAMALALVHHLAISNNLPLDMIAEYCTQLAPYLIVEFIPKSDSKVKILLATREDIFPDYTEEGFEAAFNKYYKIEDKHPVKGSERTLYLMERK